jgi:hypothetical protein
LGRKLPRPGRLAVLVQHNYRRMVPANHIQSLLRPTRRENLGTLVSQGGT